MDELRERITALIEEENGQESVTDLAHLEARILRRSTLNALLSQMASEVRQLQQRIKQLPPLPRLSAVRRAQAIQALPNLAYLEVDTTGVHQGAEVIRVLLLDAGGEDVIDCYVRPAAGIPPEISRITGVSNEIVAQAGALTEVWPAVVQAINGRYVVSYGLDFDTSKLKEQAKEHELPELVVIGECLMQLAMQFFRMDTYPALTDLCRRIGFELPPHPHQTARDRAQGQMHLLSAIAEAVYGEEPPF